MTIFELLYSGEVDDLIRNLSLSLHSAPFSLSLSLSQKANLNLCRARSPVSRVGMCRRAEGSRQTQSQRCGFPKKERKIDDVRI